MAIHFKNFYIQNKPTLINIIFLVIWMSIVIFGMTKHEFFRDEVRDLSLARGANSFIDLFFLTINEGHPILWYLLLYIEKSIIDVPLILPITSFLIAFFAISIFLFYAPFKYWFKVLFIFSSLSIYEYSIMARPYGISMLLLFIIAILYKKRSNYPIFLAIALAFLANTNLHSAIFACLISFIWLIDITFKWKSDKSQKNWGLFFVSSFIILAGLLLCALSVMPKENSIILPINANPGFIGLVKAFLDAISRPDKIFSKLLPVGLSPSIVIFLIYLTHLGFLRNPKLLMVALFGQIAFGMLFQIVYKGSARHQGLFIIFILFLFWILIESRNTLSIKERRKSIPCSIGLYLGLTSLILGNIVAIKNTYWVDIVSERSSSKALGDFLNNSEVYKNAIIIPEPDYLIESLPYYANNRIFLPRENRFRNTVSWTTESDREISIKKLLAEAKRIKEEFQQPVLVVLGHIDIDTSITNKKIFGYDRLFTWDEYDFSAFYRSSTYITDFTSAGNGENFLIYEIK